MIAAFNEIVFNNGAKKQTYFNWLGARPFHVQLKIFLYIAGFVPFAVFIDR